MIVWLVEDTAGNTGPRVLFFVVVLVDIACFRGLRGRLTALNGSFTILDKKEKNQL